MFQDRIDAGLALAGKLLHYKNANGVILAVPRGGVPVALPIASMLQLPLEITLSKKIGHPLQKEYAIGAVSLTGRYVAPNAPVSPQYIEEETVRIRHELLKMYKKFMGKREPEPVKDKIVIIIDDGVATGHTMINTIEMLREELPHKIVVAIPVASRQAAQKLSEVVDEFICELIPSPFRAVGDYYEDFTQVSDDEVVEIMSSKS
jgi:predicted phosphoribosyltransferase